MNSNKKLTTHDFISKSNSIHGKYDYSLVEYVNMHTPVIIKCDNHGEFLQKPVVHLHHKRGCPKCGGSSPLTIDVFIERSIDTHGDTYDYSRSIYTNVNTKLEIICPTHGSFFQTPKSHMKGIGCKLCGYASASKKRQGDIYNYIDVMKAVHSDRYSYPNYNYNNIHSNIDIICPTHGSFKQTVANHLYNKTGCPKCKNIYSSQEQTIKLYLDANDIRYIERDKTVLNGLELDFYIPDKNIAIECNGLYWHGEIYGGKDRNYHLNKTKLCKEQDIRLIHIYEDELLFNERIVISKLNSIFSLNKTRVYGRNCEVKEIDSKLKTKFLKKYHLQGDCKSRTNLGLYYKNKLVSVMTFSKRRIGVGNIHNKLKNEYELSRFCNNYNTYVIGGASKLLKYFERNYEISKIITYSDERWSVGGVYFKLGFTYKHTSKPNYWYYDKHLRKRFYRFNFRKSELPKKLEKFDPNKTEWQNMQDNGWDRIWDCGNMVFEKMIDNS